MRKRRVYFSETVVARILGGLCDGERLGAICREPGMPTSRQVQVWIRTYPEFGELVETARAFGGLTGVVGRPTRCTPEMSDAIYIAICYGASLADLGRHPDFPDRSTLHMWMRRHPEFRYAVLLGRKVHAEAVAERGWAVVQSLSGSGLAEADADLTRSRGRVGQLGGRPRRA